MSDNNALGIRSGIRVQIRRTDGRTHGAIISNVSFETKTVTVEWLEQGETKGKEVDFATIYALNSDIQPTPQLETKSVELSHADRVTAPSSWDEEDEDGDDDDIDVDDDDDDDLPAIESRRDELTADSHNGNVKESTTSLPVRSLPNPRTGTSNSSTQQLQFTKGRVSHRLTGAPNTNGLNSQSSSMSRVDVHHISAVTEATSRTQRQSTIQSNTNGLSTQNIPAPPRLTDHLPSQSLTTSEASGRKKLNVVKEVEKLKKNREERRQKQAEMKEEKEALMNIDPGNPRWEFLAMIREYQSSLEIRPLKETDPVECHQITVCVRKRPLNKKELNRKEVDVITVPRKDLIIVHEPKTKVDLTKYLENQQFRFDYAFNETCSNELVYKYTAKPLVKTLFEGGMATCFAYGQTGSGKTHTMGGTLTKKVQDCKKGIYAMVAKDVFKFLNCPQYKTQNLVVSASFFEIYSGKVFDLLADKAKLRVLEDAKQQVQVVGLMEKVVNSVEEVLQLIQAGNSARTSGQTSANSNSSRSHAIFQITLRTGGLQKVFGKFSLIDLAGNERGADTSSANRLTRMEGAEINKSLLALKECIRALGRKGAHLPFRASKLTQVLRDSFICDNTKTCMIAMISPGMSSCEHSLNTLRYADRVKELVTTDILEEPNNRYQGVNEQESQDELQNQDDLATLMNEGELSADLYSFHEAVSQLQQREEEMLDSLKIWREMESRLGPREDYLLSLTRDVDYDQDSFANKIDEVVKERLRCLLNLQEKVTAFKCQLVTEEEISRKMNPNNTPRPN